MGVRSPSSLDERKFLALPVLPRGNRDQLHRVLREDGG